jgi:hypothetical protein
MVNFLRTSCVADRSQYRPRARYCERHGEIEIERGGQIKGDMTTAFNEGLDQLEAL